MKIKTLNLFKTYNGKEILKDISLEIQENKITVFIGPNGAGKTTIFKILSLLEKPTSGKLFFNEIDTTKITEKEKLNLRRKISMVFQNPVLFKDTVFNNVAYGLKIRKETEIKKKVTEALKQVQMEKFKNQNALTLSGGEMQRVVLAQRLVFAPEIIFLDEPTTNIDLENTKIIEEIIFNLKQNLKTIVLATHNFAQAKKLADEIIILNEGKIIAAGEPKTILHQTQRFEF